MMSLTSNMIVLIFVGTLVLFIALRWGVIGGGAGIERDKHPVVFWLSVAVTVVLVAAAVIGLILKLL